jgi:uncharacterized protein YndB with AHSA1/START domain
MAGQSDGFRLAMKREIPAVCAVVFRACVDPNQLASWFGPKGFTIPNVEFDARVGERYRVEMQPPDGDRFYLTGEILEVDPPRRLAFTFAWEEPNPDDVGTEVALSFRDLGESTEVDLTQGLFMTEARRALHHDGWSDSFDKLDRILSAQASV